MHEFVKNTTGIILAGGKSSRMGQNKALLKINGETVIERITKIMKKCFKEVIIITNTPEEYGFLGLNMFEDIHKSMGPLAGIHSGLTHSNNESNFILSCDVPLINEKIIRFICNYWTDKDIRIAKAEGYQQHLCGVYSKKLYGIAENILNNSVSQNNSSRALHSFLDTAGFEIIDTEIMPFDTESCFLNLNRPEDYNKLLNFAG